VTHRFEYHRPTAFLPLYTRNIEDFSELEVDIVEVRA
jgi:hypothetical protein